MHPGRHRTYCGRSHSVYGHSQKHCASQIYTKQAVLYPGQQPLTEDAGASLHVQPLHLVMARRTHTLTPQEVTHIAAASAAAADTVFPLF